MEVVEVLQGTPPLEHKLAIPINIHLLCDSAIPLPFSQKQMKIYVHKKSHKRMLIATLFIIV